MKLLKIGLSTTLFMLTIGLCAQNNLKKVLNSSPYEISLEINSGGIVSQNNIALANASKISVDDNTTATFKILANTGYEINSVKFDGSEVKSEISNNLYTTPNINGNSTLSVNFRIKQYRLSVRTGDGGGFILMCDYNSTPSFDISAPRGKTIALVLFNEIDITNSIESGICTVPAISTNSSLIVTYNDVPTYTKTSANNIESVYAANSNVVVKNPIKGDVISIYTLLGKQINSIKSDGNTIYVPLQKGMVYIVKTKQKTYKVVI